MKKPKIWITALSALLCISVLAACAADANVIKNTPDIGAQTDDASIKYPWSMVSFPDSYPDKVEIITHQVENGVFAEAYHTASRGAGGLLFRLARHTPAAFEDYWVTQFIEGNPVTHFAKDDRYYYSYELATAVQYAPEDASVYAVLIEELSSFIIPRMIEQNGLTPYDHSLVAGAEYTYPGNHAIAAFTRSDGSLGKMILSQPVYQNSRGIWCVERQTDSAGIMYPVLPDTDLTAMEYYTQLQNACDAGERQLQRPDETAAEYISGVLKLEPYPLSMSTYNDKDLREEQIKNLEALFKDGGWIWYQEDFRQSSIPDNSTALRLEINNTGDNVVDFARIRAMFENCSWTPATEEPVIPPGSALYLGDDSVNCFIFIPDSNNVTYIEDHATVTYTVNSASGKSLTDLMLDYFPD